MRAVFAVIFLFLSLSLFAQTPAQKLEQAVKIYNAMEDFLNAVAPGPGNETTIARLQADTGKAFPLLKAVETEGSPQETKAARYFRACFTFELGFTYCASGMTGTGKEILDGITADFAYFADPGVYPFAYAFEGKTFTVRFENFAPMLAEYYSAMAEVSLLAGKHNEATVWARKSLSFSHSGSWFRYVASCTLLRAKENLGQWDQEMLDAGVEHIRIVVSLDTASQRIIRENKFATAQLGYQLISLTLQKQPALAAGEKHRGEAAPLLAKAGMSTEALKFYEAAVGGGYGDKEYLFSAADYALKEDNARIANLALDRINGSAWLSCYDWDRLAEQYGRAGNAEKQKAARSKAGECRKQQQKAREKDERVRHGRGPAGFYMGIYPLAMATRYGRYRDYGAVFGIMTPRFAAEVSYKKINRNLVFAEDLLFGKGDAGNGGDKYYWDGYRAHVALKFLPRNGNEGFYVGPLFEMVGRNYEAVYSDVLDASGITVLQNDKAFYPTEKTYNLLLNYGMSAYDRFFYIDLFTGMGVSYNIFDGGGAEYGDSNYQLGNSLLDVRKPARAGFMIRMGVTLGFGLWKK